MKTAREDHSVLQADESLDNLGWGNLKLIQPKKGNRFSLDALLLAHFVFGEAPEKLLDIGCASGVLSLLLSQLMPQAEIDGIEIQSKSAERAQRNVDLNLLRSRIKIYPGDIRDQNHTIYQNRYDQIVCNPPFFKVGEGILNPNSELAISRHELTLKLDDLLTAARKLLLPHARLTIIYRMERLDEVRRRLHFYHLFISRLQFVQSFVHQPAKLFLVECGPRKPAFFQELPPLIVYQAPGIYTEEISRMMIP